MPPPDVQIHPVATGRAAETFAKHEAPQDLVLWSGWFCPFVQRSLVALEEKGIPYQYKEVNPYKKEKHFLDINPKGLVPALEYKGRPLYESLVINEFLDDLYPDTNPLVPSDPFERARGRLWIDHFGKNVVPGSFRLISAQEPEKQEEHLKEYVEALAKLAKEVKGPYFFGENFTQVDAAIAPWVVRDYILVRHRGFSREQVGEKWVAYAKELETRPSVLNTTSDQEHYDQIHKRYLDNTAQSEAAKAVRAGRPIP